MPTKRPKRRVLKQILCSRHEIPLVEGAGLHFGRGQWLITWGCPKCSFSVLRFGKPVKRLTP